MRKLPNVPLLLLAVVVVGGGYLLTSGGIQCQERPLQPGQTCLIGGSTTTYEELASSPIRQFSTFLLVAGGLALAAVLIGLFRRPTSLISPYDWPGRTRTRSLVVLVVVAGAVTVVGSLSSTSAVTCGGQQIQPGDRCVDYRDGGSVSYSDVSSAPIRQFWIYLVIAGVLVTTAIVKLIRRRLPTRDEVEAFEATTTAIRQRLINLPEARAANQPVNWRKHRQEELARFDHDVEQERRRAGISIAQ